MEAVFAFILGLILRPLAGCDGTAAQVGQYKVRSVLSYVPLRGVISNDYENSSMAKYLILRPLAGCDVLNGEENLLPICLILRPLAGCDGKNEQKRPAGNRQNVPFS